MMLATANGKQRLDHFDHQRPKAFGSSFVNNSGVYRVLNTTQK